MQIPSPPPGDRRVLICGPAFPPGDGGGLALALRDLADALSLRGWAVDLAITPEELDLQHGAAPVAFMPRWTTRRWARAPRFRALPQDVRTLLHHTLLGGGVARTQSMAMHAIERKLARVRYAAVVALVYKPSPGFAHFITTRHPNVLLLSLDALASELRLAQWLWIPRIVSRLAPGRRHQELYRPVRPAQIRMAVFGSKTWRDEALRAGLPPDQSEVIPFGVDSPGPLTALPASRGRLLWIGRCSPEKGLHVFLDAVAELRRTRRVSLTAVCGAGPERYRLAIERQLDLLNLRDVVRLIPQVPRARLAHFYSTHDALLFHSAFEEPMALVLLEAFSAGIPVVAPHPTADSALISPDHTCVCFDTSAPAAVARAAARALDDVELRERVRRHAHALVRAGFSLDAMGRAYDAALRRLCAKGDCPPRPLATPHQAAGLPT